MQLLDNTIKRAFTDGTLAGIAIAATAALAGKRETGSYSAPLNATSHILWGDKAAGHSVPSLKYTATGFVLNHAAAIFWAVMYEKLVDARVSRSGTTASPLRALVDGAVVSAGAYVTDYHLVPSRFTPGFEKRLSGKSLLVIYGALAFGLAARDILSARRR
jgi:hypothetical protein